MQGYCKVHQQRYQVMQAAPPSLPPKPQAPPIPSTKASSSMSRDHITMISDLRHPQGWFQVHGDEPDFAPEMAQKASSEPWAEGTRVAKAFCAGRV